MKKRYARILAATLSAAMVFTSAPTAALATEVDVVDEVVDVEGAAKETDIDDCFPSKLTYVYGSGLSTVNVDKAEKANNAEVYTKGSTDVDSGTTTIGFKIADIQAANVGDDVTAELVFTAAGTVDYSELAGYNKTGGTVTVKRTAKVEILPSEADLTSSLTLTEGSTVAATVEYGTDKVKVVDNSGNSVAGWTLKSVDSAAILAAKAGDVVENGAVIESGKFLQANYKKSFDDFVKKLNSAAVAKVYSYNTTTQKFERKINVTVGNINIDPVDIEWPLELAAGQSFGVGDQLDKVKLETTATSKYGKFILVPNTFTDSSANGILDPADSAAIAVGTVQSGTTAYKIVFITNDNITVNGAGKNMYVLAGTLSLKATPVTISEAEVASKLDSTEFAHGTDYDAVEAALGAANTKATYVVKGHNGSDVIPYGTSKVTFVATAVGAQFPNGKTTTEITISVTIKNPEIKVVTKITNKTGADASRSNIADSTVLFAYVTGIAQNGAGDIPTQYDVDDFVLTAKYQWYKSVKGAAATAIENATNATYTVGTLTDSTEFWCEVKLEAAAGLSDAEVATVKAAIGTDTYTSDKATASRAGFEFTSADNSSALAAKTYEYAAAIPVKVVVDEDTSVFGTGHAYTFKSAKAYVVASDGTIIALDTPTAVESGDTTISTEIPKGLDADNYTLVFEVVGKKTSDASLETAVYKEPFTIAQKAFSSLVSGADVAFAKKSYVYGTKTADIKYTANEKYGKITASAKNPEMFEAGTSQTFTFVYEATDAVKKNYSGVPGTITKSIDIDKAEIAVTTDDVKVLVGDTLPKSVSVKTTGLVGKDTLAKLGVAVMAEIDAKSVDTTKVGKYTGTVIVTAECNGAKNAAIDLKNYTISVTDGNVVVADAEEVKPSTAPTVAPTVAPTKAPAVKAAKATVSVKAGKSVALKLKNAPKGAKVTWSLDKKAKKALKVSKKGKVTVKKGAKKGTYKVYAKVNGKKVTFKVKVK